MAVVGAVAKAVDQDIDNITFSEISIRRHPRKNRKEVATAEKIDYRKNVLYNFTEMLRSCLTSARDVNALRGSSFTSQEEARRTSWKPPTSHKPLNVI